ncbi:hypothetical protein [Calidifontibacter terrae]
MAKADKKPKRVPTKLRVRGLKDTKNLTVEVKPEHLIEDVGSFTFGYCRSCDWRGPGRRSRAKARDDVSHHVDHCPGKGKAVVAEGHLKK